MSISRLSHFTLGGRRLSAYLKEIGYVLQGIALGVLIMSAFDYHGHISVHGVILFWASYLAGGYLVRISSKL